MAPGFERAADSRADWQDAMVATHAALLRGVNVGGRNLIAMADLRELCSALGHTDVATYIQSGNVVFTSTAGSPDALADALEHAIEQRLGVRSAVVVVSAERLRGVIADNPFAAETDPARLHAVFRREPLSAAGVAELEQALSRARDKGSRDSAIALGATLYLSTPDGMGRSELAKQLAKAAPARTIGGTARNWATVTKLMTMLDASQSD